MYGNLIDLIEKIRLGENSFLELKRVRLSGNRVAAPPRDSLVDELATIRGQSRWSLRHRRGRSVRSPRHFSR